MTLAWRSGLIQQDSLHPRYFLRQCVSPHYSQFDMYDHDEGVCQEGVIIIDKEGVLVYSMTTSLGYTDTALNTLDLVTTLSQAETYSKFTKVSIRSHHLLTIIGKRRSYFNF